MLKKILKIVSKETYNQKKFLVKELYPKHIITESKKKNQVQQLTVNTWHKIKKTNIVPQEYSLKKKLKGFSLFVEDYIFQSIKNIKCRFYAPISGGTTDKTDTLLKKFSFFLNACQGKPIFVRAVAAVKNGLLLYTPQGFIFFICYKEYFVKCCKPLGLHGLDKISLNKYSLGWFLINSESICAQMEKFNLEQFKTNKNAEKDGVLKLQSHFKSDDLQKLKKKTNISGVGTAS